MSGAKKVEFRKRLFGRDVSHVVVYASSPVQRVLGYFEVEEVEQASPRELWRRYSAVGGIQRGDYDLYFGPAKSGVAIRVRKVHVLAKPLRLAAILESGRAPQSYTYLTGTILRRLTRRRSRDVTDLET